MSSSSQKPTGSAPGASGTTRADRRMSALGVGLGLLGLAGGLWAAHWQQGPVPPEPRRHLTDFTLADRYRAETNRWLFLTGEKSGWDQPRR